MERHQLLKFEIVTNETDVLFNEGDCTIKENEMHNDSEEVLYFFEEAALESLPESTKRSHKVQEIYIALAMSKITHPRIY